MVVFVCVLAGLGACRRLAWRAASDAGVYASACDEYHSKMMRCLESDLWPAQTRQEWRESIDRIVKNERVAAPTPEAREMQEGTCRMGIRMMQQGMSPAMCPGVW
jgi:hypothetical protein